MGLFFTKNEIVRNHRGTGVIGSAVHRVAMYRRLGSAHSRLRESSESHEIACTGIRWLARPGAAGCRAALGANDCCHPVPVAGHSGHGVAPGREGVMYRLITICAVSLLLLGCESPQQIVDRQAAEAREANWQRRYIQDRAESAAAANLQADKAAPNAAPRPDAHPTSPDAAGAAQ